MTTFDALLVFAGSFARRLSCTFKNKKSADIDLSVLAIAKPAPVKAKMAIQATRSWAADLQYHETLFDENKTVDEKTDQQSRNVHTEEITTTPLFSANVLASVLETKAAQADDVLPQYGLLAKVLERFGDNELREVISLQVSDSLSYELPSLAAPEDTPKQEDNRLFININAPWSAFICGSQGSGKSHTVSCMLEVALLPSKLGKLPRPLAGMVFHYDKFTGFSSSQICEFFKNTSASARFTKQFLPHEESV